MSGFQVNRRTFLAGAAGASFVGLVREADGAQATTVEKKLFVKIDVFDFMTEAEKADVTAGSLNLDHTPAFLKAVAEANRFLRNGLVETMKHPGARLTLQGGRYNLASLAGPISILCNLADDGAELVVPAGYAKEVLLIGHNTAGISLFQADIHVPAITKPKDSAIVAGSEGYRVANLCESRVFGKRVQYFETAVKLGGDGEGTAACDLWMPAVNYCKRAYVVRPGAAGWFNANRIHGGHVQQSVGYAGGSRVAGWRHWLIDGSAPATSVVGNTFIGPVLEGNVSEYLVEMRNAYGNTFLGMYHESGASPQAVTVAGDTLTHAAHGRQVGDMVAFQATAAPGGMQLAVPYYVVAVPSAYTFKVSLDKGGAAVVFSSAGNAVTNILAQSCLFDGTGGAITAGNRFINTFTPTSVFIDYIETGQATGNGLDSPFYESRRAYSPEDFPIFRGGNTSNAAGLSRPAFAAYANGVNQNTDPKNWSAALGDRGVLWAAGRVEIGRLFNSGGVIQYQRPADAVAYEVASCRRSPGLVAVAANVPANGGVTVALALVGASINDHVTVTPAADLPDGISIAWARVSAADTIKVRFANATGAPVDLAVNVQLMAVRRYY